MKQRVIFDAFFQLIVLLRELLVLVLHFAAVHVGQLTQFFEFFVLVVFLLLSAVAGCEGKAQDTAGQDVEKEFSHKGRVVTVQSIIVTHP